MRGLYAIVDVETVRGHSLPILEVTRAIASVEPAAIQLRAKNLSAQDSLALLRQMLPVCQAAGVPLFANDRADLALLADCAGVHVGQDDLHADAISRLFPSLRVGMSTHSLGQAAGAASSNIAYLAIGPVFATRSKRNPEPTVGVDALRAAVRDSPIPVVAIGGIDLSNVAIIAAITPIAAVISALFPSSNCPFPLVEIAERARKLHELLQVAPPGLEPGNPLRDEGF